MKKKITSPQCWVLTAAAILDLMALIFMSSASASIGALAMFAVCEVALIVLVIMAWKRYFEELIEEKSVRE